MTFAPQTHRAVIAGRSLGAFALLVICTCAFAAPAQTTQPWRPDLFAYGSRDRFSIAYVEPHRDDSGAAGYKTSIRQRQLPDGPWTDLGAIFGRAEGLAHLQGDLVVLLEEGTWKRVSNAFTFTSGTNLPGTGPVLGWGGSPTALYAVRAVEGGLPALLPTTQPATAAPATTRAVSIATQASTRPTTRPAPAVLMLYDRGDWSPAAELPARLAGVPVSLAVVDERPSVAYRDGDAIRVMSWLDNAFGEMQPGWQELGRIPTGGNAAQFGLVAAGKSLAVWVIDRDGGIRLFVHGGEDWTQANAFALPADVAPDAKRTIAVAGDELRLIVAKDGKFWEQLYDFSGNPKGGKTELPLPAKYQRPGGLWAFQGVIMLAVVLALLITYYRRRAAGEGGDAEKE